MEHEFSAATIATPLEEEEQEGGFIEGADDLLRVLPHDLANPQPVLHVITRRQEELGGGPVASFARCRDQGCSPCTALDCGGLQASRGLQKLCLPCHHSNPSLCVLRLPCLSWDFEKRRQFREAQEAHILVGRADLLTSPEHPHLVRSPDDDARKDAGAASGAAGGATGWTREERLDHEHLQRQYDQIEPERQLADLNSSGRRGEILQPGEDDILSGITPAMDVSPSQRYPSSPPGPNSGDVELRRTDNKQDLSQLHGQARLGRGGEEKFHLGPTSDHLGGQRDPTVFGPRITSTPERSVRFNLSDKPKAAWVAPPQGWSGPRVPGPPPPKFAQAVHVPSPGQGGNEHRGGTGGHSWHGGQGYQGGTGGQSWQVGPGPQAGQGQQGGTGGHSWQVGPGPQAGQGQQGGTGGQNWQVGPGPQAGQGPQGGTGGQSWHVGPGPQAGQGQEGGHGPQVGPGGPSWQGGPGDHGTGGYHHGQSQQPPPSTWWGNPTSPPVQPWARPVNPHTLAGQPRPAENVALNQHKIVDYLELMTEKLMAGTIGGVKQQTSQLKLPNLNLPVPRKNQDGRVDTKAYHLWRISLERTISNNRLPEEAVLSLLATNVKLTSDDWLATFQASSTLQEALGRLSTFHAPIQHLYGQLIREITEVPALHGLTTTERIFQLNQLIQHTDEFITFFGNTTDLNREHTLIVLAKIACSSAGRDLSLRNIYAFDEAFRAGKPYSQSLKAHLIEARLLSVDLEAALETISESERKKPVALRTAATSAEAHQEKPVRREGGGAARAARPTAHCHQCGKAGHMSYVCPDLKRIKTGEMKLKANLCKKCVGKVEPGKPHLHDCATKRMLIDNVYVLLKFTCDHDLHVRLCPNAKCVEAKTKKVLDQDQTPPPKVERSFTNRVISLAQTSRTSPEDCQVAFLKEVSALKGKDGQTMKCLVLFDSMGSKSFIRCKAGALPENYDWGPAPQHQTYSITTITGEQVVEKKVYEISLISVRGLERVTAVEGGLEGELYGGILPPSLASAYGVDSPEKSALEEPAVVLILGSDMSHLMPRVRAPPRQLRRQQPGLMLADSILSNRTLYFGPVQTQMRAPPRRPA